MSILSIIFALTLNIRNMKTQQKVIKVLLKPSDFIDNKFFDNDDCALSRACKRHFKVEYANVGWRTLDIEYPNGDDVSYIIKDKFGREDYDYVKEAYEKDPKMKKAEYYVKLILVK